VRCRLEAASIASVTAESVYEDLERVSNPVNRADLNATAAFNLRAISGGAFVAIAAPEGIVVVAARSGLGSKPVQLALEQNPQAFVRVGIERFVVAQQPVLKYDGTGSLGRVYIGLETTGVMNRVWQALLPTLGLLSFALLLAAGLGTWLADGITRKMLHATQTANRISLGDLEGCTTQHANDEIGDLTRALERMRYSLKFMLERSKRKS
jgi:HAMP domain-containing protein